MERRVLVTGANSGIGLATTLELARRGFTALGAVRSTEAVEELEKAAAEAGVEVSPVFLDVEDADRAAEVVPGLDLWGLVNNAGSMNPGPIEEVPDDEVRAQFEAMVLGPMRLARLALPAMRARGQGRIVNVSSVMAYVTLPVSGWYQAMKHALSGVTDALRVEVAAGGVDVVLVEPGTISTPIWDRAAATLRSRDVAPRYQETAERALGLMGLARRRGSEPEDVAEVVADALVAGRPRARYVVGADALAAGAFDTLLPRRVRDRAVRAAMGL